MKKAIAIETAGSAALFTLFSSKQHGSATATLIQKRVGRCNWQAANIQLLLVKQKTQWNWAPKHALHKVGRASVRRSLPSTRHVGLWRMHMQMGNAIRMAPAKWEKETQSMKARTTMNATREHKISTWRHGSPRHIESNMCSNQTQGNTAEVKTIPEKWLAANQCATHLIRTW